MTRHAILTLLTLLAAAGCGAAAGGVSPASGPSGMTAEEYEELYRARLESARSRYTPADVQFMTHMIHHHAQALEMAEMVPDRTQNQQIHILAGRIINAQNDEIALMRRWLEDRGEPVPPPAGGEAAGHGAMDHAQHHEMQMPGMLTRDELAALERTRGPEFDRLFLTSMIRHHEGAVTMVEELFATDGAAQDEEAFKFASDAQVDQATEIARMQSMLDALPAAGAGR